MMYDSAVDPRAGKDERYLNPRRTVASPDRSVQSIRLSHGLKQRSTTFRPTGLRLTPTAASPLDQPPKSVSTRYTRNRRTRSKQPGGWENDLVNRCAAVPALYSPTHWSPHDVLRPEKA